MNLEEKLIIIAENEQKVYDAGYAAGQEAGGGSGVVSAFMDEYLQHGAREDFQGAFFGTGWTVDLFQPNHDMRPIQCFEMFRGNTMEIDLAAHLEKLGVELDFSQTSGLNSMFYNSRFTKIGVVDMTSASNVTYVFHNCVKLTEILLIVLKSDGSQDPSSWFSNCSLLQEIRFEGCIGKNINLSMCNGLTVESMKSVITHLKNYAGTANELKYTVQFTEACWEALEADSAAPNGDTWSNYVSSLGWNF